MAWDGRIDRQAYSIRRRVRGSKRRACKILNGEEKVHRNLRPVSHRPRTRARSFKRTPSPQRGARCHQTWWERRVQPDSPRDWTCFWRKGASVATEHGSEGHGRCTGASSTLAAGGTGQNPPPAPALCCRGTETGQDGPRVCPRPRHLFCCAEGSRHKRNGAGKTKHRDGLDRSQAS